MTIEEAIKILKAIRVYECYPKSASEETKEALDMAIEALKNEPIPCERCIHVKSCRKVILLKDKRYKLIRYCSQGAERKTP